MTGVSESPVTRRQLLLAASAATVAAAVRVEAQASPLGAATSRDVGRLVDAMTLPEKVAMLHGTTDPASLGQGGYIPGVDRLGVPELRLADGPAGVRLTARATALPAPVALAATFSPEFARQYGAVIGEEGRSLGIDVVFAPMTNLVRVPQAGRNFETLGEDPVLASILVAAEVEGIQDAGLIATVKHHAVNNFENNRQSISAEVDERTLREVYLPAFEAAVRAGSGAVMAANNRVNGVFATENPHLLAEVLRDEWGFAGFVVSDFFATHSAAPALRAGLDVELPSGIHFPTLVAAVQDGQVPEAFVDTAVRRIVSQMKRFGLLGRPRRRPPLNATAHARTAHDVAVAGAVLLRNEHETLPLSPSMSDTLAVIGPTAGTPLVGGRGSARVIPTQSESPLDAFRRRVGSRLQFAPGIDLDGVPVPASVLSLQRTQTGGSAQAESQVDYTGASALPAGTAWTWEGTLAPPDTGEYDLRIQGAGGAPRPFGSITLAIDGVQIGAAGALLAGNNHPIVTAGGLENAGALVDLIAGQTYDVRITATAGATAPLEVRLAWVTPESRQQAIDDAARVAGSVRTAVVFAFNGGTEGADRASLALPQHQDRLIEAVAAANPRTVVVLNVGDPVLMPWIDRTPAVLQAWYPGQEGADATAALLFGEENPSGKLPITFPQQAEDAPTAPLERYPGVDGRAIYSEGILIGYRHYDAAGIAPLFPFGHGLSYTRFEYRDVSVHQVDSGLEVNFAVENVGRRSGIEVPQVYLAPPASPPVPMAPRQLAGIGRIGLRPGERRHIHIDVPARAMSYWDVPSARWVVVTGRREVLVGSSSRDIRLSRTVKIEGEVGHSR